MGGGDPATEPSLFDDVFSPEAKKVTAVYTRRPKKAAPQVLEPLESSEPSRVAVANPPPEKRNSIFVFRDEGARNRNAHSKNRKSWYNRSLSFRGRRSSLVSTGRQPLASVPSNLIGNPALVTPDQKAQTPTGNANDVVVLTANTRRTWAGVPLAFLKEQRAHFADIDAFSLDAQEGGYSPSPKKQQARESLDLAFTQYHANNIRPGRAPGSAESSTNKAGYDLLSAALMTPRPAAVPRPPCKIAPYLVPQFEIAAAETSLPRTSLRFSINTQISEDGEDPAQPSQPSSEILASKQVRRSSRRSSKSASLGKGNKHIPTTDQEIPTSTDIFTREDNPGRSTSIPKIHDEQARTSTDNITREDNPERRSRSISSFDEQARTSTDNISREENLGRRSRSIPTIDEQGPTQNENTTMEDIIGRRSRSLPKINEQALTSTDPSTMDGGAYPDFGTSSFISRLDPLQLREDEELEFRFGKISLCTPVLEEEDEDGEIFDSSSDEEAAEIQVVDLDAEQQVETEQLLSVFDALLQECQQTRLLTFSDALSDFCNLRDIKKLGEGTFGEAFKGGGNVFKIVPMDGTFLVNGEHQKTSAEMFSEVVLSNALNKLRGGPFGDSGNMCTTFVETKATRICQGCYDPELVRAWEDWDAKNTSENDHPLLFPDQQLYVVFVLTDGGRDLESFVLANFNEARSLLVQVVLALAVGEEVCQFEHRDLHWGNIVIARDEEEHVPFRLLGEDKHVKSFGVHVSLIDFTLSRLDTGKDVFFCNLAADPALFEGPTGDVQADTYRRMLKVTQGKWEGRFLKTNCLWIHYVADILLNKKAFSCSPHDKRSLRAFRKRVLLYESAGAVVQDDFFDGMWADL